MNRSRGDTVYYAFPARTRSHELAILLQRAILYGARPHCSLHLNTTECMMDVSCLSVLSLLVSLITACRLIRLRD